MTTARDHEAADVDEVGQRGADVHRRADQREHRGRQPRHGVRWRASSEEKAAKK